jgi:thiamine-monophosphate kinase
MINKFSKLKSITESEIIEKYLKKLNFDKRESFGFKNDSAYLNSFKNKKTIVTNDSIIENVDFFKNDSAQSIAHKIVTSNLSDLSAMGAKPYCYTLNLCMPKYITIDWLESFSYYLIKLQKKYNFFLLGGDLSKSKQLMISSTFFGHAEYKNIILRDHINIDDDIWVTGSLGETYAGLKILKNKISKNLDIKIKNYFLKKYYFPTPCMIGYKIAKYCNSGIDVSDGFICDLKKMIGTRFGAKIQLNSLPTSRFMKIMLKKNALRFDEIINCGDDYELILIVPKKNYDKILEIAYKNKIKISKIGKIIKTKGIFSEYGKSIIQKNYFKHFA